MDKKIITSIYQKLTCISNSMYSKIYKVNSTFNFAIETTFSFN